MKPHQFYCVCTGERYFTEMTEFYQPIMGKGDLVLGDDGYRKRQCKWSVDELMIGGKYAPFSGGLRQKSIFCIGYPPQRTGLNRTNEIVGSNKGDSRFLVGVSRPYGRVCSQEKASSNMNQKNGCTTNSVDGE